MGRESKEFERFSETTKRLLSISKEELNRREAEWKKQGDHGERLRRPSDAPLTAILLAICSS
jgi:hypothetical protein